MARISRVKPEPDVSEAVPFLDMIVGAIGQPNDRSYQVKIGPSGLGDPCDHCVAMVLVQQLHPARVQPSTGNLPTWIGTAMHYYLEHHLVGPKWDAIGMHNELPQLYIGDIPGYGKIKGTADAYSEEYATVVDYKGSTKKKIQGYKMQGMLQGYRFQRHMYGKGVELQGMPVKYVANLFIPRDGFSFSDMWYDIEPYDPDMAGRALARATTIFKEYVLKNKIDELGSDEDCYTCNAYTAPARVILKRRSTRGN